MPICLNIESAKPEAIQPNQTMIKLPRPEWREPPGMLGVYVRRVKKQMLARPESDG